MPPRTAIRARPERGASKEWTLCPNNEIGVSVIDEATIAGETNHMQKLVSVVLVIRERVSE
ncbi:hypothetical protein GCM10009861_24720 [Neomicrococcus aestuarii]